METHICIECGEEKELTSENFWRRNAATIISFSTTCIPCHSFLLKEKQIKKPKPRHTPFLPIDGEIWGDVPGFNGAYRVSDMGRVLSVKRTIDVFLKGKPRQYNIAEKIMCPHLDKTGYLTIKLSNTYGKTRTWKLHRLLMMVFKPVSNPDDLVVNHIDGNKLNLALHNLEWCTNKENLQHAWRIGLHRPKAGVKNGRTKLKESDVLIIRSMSLKDIPELAIKYGVSKTTIRSIITQDSWKHL